MAHPRFETSGPEHQWTGPLPTLWERLRKDAYALEGAWAYRVLPRGATVWLRINDNFRKELLLSRPGWPADPKDVGPWENECWTFLNAFPAQGVWHTTEFGPVTEPDGEQIMVARFLEIDKPRPGPIEPDDLFSQGGP